MSDYNADLVFKHVHDGIYRIRQDNLSKYNGYRFVTTEDIVQDLNQYAVIVLDKHGHEIDYF